MSSDAAISSVCFQSAARVASVPPGRPKGLTAPPRGAASGAFFPAASVGALSVPPGRPKGLTAPPRGAASGAFFPAASVGALFAVVLIEHPVFGRHERDRGEH